jgi:hypothetical protein
MLWALTATLKWAVPLRISIETFTIVGTSAGRIVSLSTTSIERIGVGYIGQVAYFVYTRWRIL